MSKTINGDSFINIDWQYSLSRSSLSYVKNQNKYTFSVRTNVDSEKLYFYLNLSPNTSYNFKLKLKIYDNYETYDGDHVNFLVAPTNCTNFNEIKGSDYNNLSYKDDSDIYSFNVLSKVKGESKYFISFATKNEGTCIFSFNFSGFVDNQNIKFDLELGDGSIYKLPFQTTDVFYNGLINDEWKADENIQGSYVKPIKIIEQKHLKNNTYNSIYINNHTLPDEYERNRESTFIYKKIKGLKSGCNYRIKFKIRANYIYDLITKERDDNTNSSRYAVNFVGSFVECKHEYLTTSDKDHEYVSVSNKYIPFKFDINSKHIKCNLPDNSYTEVEANFKKDSMDEHFDYNMYLLIPNYLESHTNSSNSKAPSFLYIEIKDFIIENLDEDKLLTFGTKNELTKDNITWEIDSKGPASEFEYVKTIDKDGYQFSFSFISSIFSQYGYYIEHPDKPFLFTNLNLKPNTRYTLYMNVTHKNVPNKSCLLMIKYGSSTLTSKGNYVNEKFDHSDWSGPYYNYDVEHWMSFRTDETGKVTIGFTAYGIYDHDSEIYIKEFSYKEINETINDNHFTQPKLNENIKQTDNLIIYRNHIVNSLFRRTTQLYRLTFGHLTDLTKKYPLNLEDKGYGLKSYTRYPEGVMDTTYTDYLICNRIKSPRSPGDPYMSNDTYINVNSDYISSDPNIDDYDGYINPSKYPDGYYQFQLITSASRKSKYSAYSKEKLAEIYKGYLQLMDGKNEFDFKSYGLDRMKRFNFVGYKNIDTSPVGLKHCVYTTDESKGFVKILMIKSNNIEALMTKQ